jgi:hypothetical protein
MTEVQHASEMLCSFNQNEMMEKCPKFSQFNNRCSPQTFGLKTEHPQDEHDLQFILREKTYSYNNKRTNFFTQFMDHISKPSCVSVQINVLNGLEL